ncbi:MAG: NYN domain-containing protein [Tenuifilaceae bacterium]|jgi:hypothetical protein|nr:NYN domain-containing protein [Tenuifilaceae bacterium]
MKCISYLDINNIFFRHKKLDFKKLKEWIENQYEIVRLNAFNAIDHKNELQVKFNIYLSNNGYKVENYDISLVTNVDPIIITTMCTDALYFKHNVILLVACDGGYSYPLNELSKRGYKIHVVGVKNNTSTDLLKIADNISYLEDIGVVL